ncbi:hypothetical protein ACGF07_35375 [Kitasatospora sp. NPDC048194]|uniref:hypothetical protein n=1 Tax=Kitasatospora sp. NPDC048194 TaxID=3364045 RepID=UPI0037248B9C
MLWPTVYLPTAGRPWSGRPQARPTRSILADIGHTRSTGGCFTGPGRLWLAELPLPDASRHVVDGLFAVLAALQPQINAA